MLRILKIIAWMSVCHSVRGAEVLPQGLRIGVPSSMEASSLDLGESLKERIVQEGDVEADKARIKDGSRMFILEANDSEGIKRAAELLLKYGEPPKEVMDVLANGIAADGLPELTMGFDYSKSFIVYFLDEASLKLGIDAKSIPIDVYVLTDRKLDEKISAQDGVFYGYNAGDRSFFSLPLEERRINEMAALIMTRSMGEITLETIEYYKMLTIPIFYLFFAENKQDELTKILTDAAPFIFGIRKRSRFVALLGTKEGVDLTQLGLSVETLPGCVYIDTETAMRHVQKSLTAENLRTFCEAVLNNTSVPIKISQDEPADNDELAVRIVTRNTLSRYLEDVEKDRLLVFVGYRCGFCKRLGPHLEELGKLVKARGSARISVGTCDVYLNDIDLFKIEAVPTIYLLKAGTNEMVSYDRDERELEDLVQFIAEKGTHKIDLSQHPSPSEAEPAVETRGEEKKVEL
jgi:thiol-disulfide isomerase/thioredoxin